MRLRDGTEAQDRRLDRQVDFDARSRRFPIRTAIPGGQREPRSQTWTPGPYLNQGREGACVGFGISHELGASPSPVPGLTNQFAREDIYWQAQREDQWPGGAYAGAKPFYEGTSVLSGVKVAQKLGYFAEYRWAFGVEDLILGVGWDGPAVLGLAWRRGMQRTDARGYIHPTGSIQGGHCILCRDVDIERRDFTLQNSWGTRWGTGGDCRISWEDMDALLRDRKHPGEAVFFLRRRTVPGP